MNAESLDLYRANLHLQRRTRIEARRRRIGLLQDLLRITPEPEQAEVLEFEIAKLRIEIEAEGPDA